MGRLLLAVALFGTLAGCGSGEESGTVEAPKVDQSRCVVVSVGEDRIAVYSPCVGPWVNEYPAYYWEVLEAVPGLGNLHLWGPE